MSYRLTIEKRDEVLWVTATGTRTRENVLAMSKDILTALAANKVTKVLVDVRALAGRLNTLDSYDIVDSHFPEVRDRSVIVRCGIIDRKEDENSYQFFENLAINRGFALRIFPDAAKALAWLEPEKVA